MYYDYYIRQADRTLCGIVLGFITSIVVGVLIHLADVKCTGTTKVAQVQRKSEVCVRPVGKVFCVGNGFQKHEMVVTEDGMDHKAGCRYCAMNHEFRTP